MLDALISGRLIKDCQLKTAKNGKPYTNFLLTVHVGEPDNIVISGIALGDAAERLAKLGKGDAVSVTGSLKPTEWEDRMTSETRHGLGITVADVLSAYDIKKRRAKPDTQGSHQPQPEYDFDDEIPI